MNTPRIAALSTVTVVMATAGCSGSSAAGNRLSGVAEQVATYVHGVPAGITMSSPSASGIPKSLVSWAGAHQLYVTTVGSGSCPTLPTSVHADGAHRVVIHTALVHRSGVNACTADLGPTTSTIDLPARIDSTAQLTVDIDGTSMTLEPRA